MKNKVEKSVAEFVLHWCVYAAVVFFWQMDDRIHLHLCCKKNTAKEMKTFDRGSGCKLD